MLSLNSTRKKTFGSRERYFYVPRVLISFFFFLLSGEGSSKPWIWTIKIYVWRRKEKFYALFTFTVYVRRRDAVFLLTLKLPWNIVSILTIKVIVILSLISNGLWESRKNNLLNFSPASAIFASAASFSELWMFFWIFAAIWHQLSATKHPRRWDTSAVNYVKMKAVKRIFNKGNWLIL